MNTYEMTTLDNASWISLHLNFVQVDRCIPFLWSMEEVDVQGIVDNMFQLMFTTLLTFGGVNVEKLGSKFISIAANGCSVFLMFKSQCDYFGEGDNGSIYNGAALFCLAYKLGYVGFIET